MKHPIKLATLKAFCALLFCMLFSLAVVAQESGSSSGESGGATTTTTTKKTTVSITSGDSSNSTWYTSPWVWIVGAAVFILLLVALLSNRDRNTVHVTKTVERDHRHGT